MLIFPFKKACDLQQEPIDQVFEDEKTMVFLLIQQNIYLLSMNYYLDVQQHS